MCFIIVCVYACELNECIIACFIVFPWHVHSHFKSDYMLWVHKTLLLMNCAIKDKKF